MDTMERIMYARALRARVMALLPGAALAAIAGRYRRLRAGWRSREMREDLARQSDYLLRDIGLRRSHFDALFR